MSLRDIERDSIRAYVTAAAKRGVFVGRVLDFGAGHTPYRQIVEDHDGEYTPHDRMHYAGSVVTTDIGLDDPLYRSHGPASDGTDWWDAILCTQVIQYVPTAELIIEDQDPERRFGLLQEMYDALAPGGRLVMTGPTNWPVVETTDLTRFTVEGIVSLLGAAGFPVVEAHYRAEVRFEGERWPLGWGCIATKGE